MGDNGLVANNSAQRLVNYSSPDVPSRRRVGKRECVSVGILCFVNLINYIDRFTIAGILDDITDTFNLSNAQAGLIQTVFVLVYMIAAPTYGYLGDRYNRRYLMSFGVFLWSLTTLIGSFMPNYWLFLLFRCLVGVGEASYSTIAPTLIADMFVKDQRSKALAFFYFAIPVGSGMGYMIGSFTMSTAKAHGAVEAWRWGLRVTPVLGIVAVLLILLAMKEPARGEVEGGEHLSATSFKSDLAYLATNRSFVLSTLAFTCVAYVAGALAWWGPIFVKYGVDIQKNPNVPSSNVAFLFGAVAMCAGLLGVPLGSFGGQQLRKRFGFGDSLICALGMLFSFPLMFSAMYIAGVNTLAAFVIVFFGQVFLNLNWSVISDILLYVVIPTRRSSAEAFQILFSHALGDAGSPYIVGVVADYMEPFYRNSTSVLPFLKSSENFSPDPLSAVDYVAKFKAMQISLFICTAVLLLGSICFFVCCIYISEDKKKADLIIAGSRSSEESTESIENIQTPENSDPLLPHPHV